MAELNRWNLTLSNRLVEVPGRILPIEQLRSNTKAYDAGIEADWTRHLRNLPMYTCVSMRSWVIVTPQDNVRDCQAFASTLQKAAQGMSFSLPTPNM